MKKIFLVLVLALVMSGAAFSMDWMSFPPALEGGNILLDAGFGLGGIGFWDDLDMVIPPMFVQVEYALPVGVPISVGGSIAFSMYEWGYLGWDWTYTYITMAGRANWHFPFEVPGLDVYAGASMGYDIEIVDEPRGAGKNWHDSYGGFHIGFHGGVRYYFTDTIGVMAETGYPYWVKAGLAVKF